MAQLLPNALERAINELGRLPGVGPRTAERYAYFLLRADERTAQSMARALIALHSDVKTCPVTFALINADEDISPLYSDTTRDKRTIAPSSYCRNFNPRAPHGGATHCGQSPLSTLYESQ